MFSLLVVVVEKRDDAMEPIRSSIVNIPRHQEVMNR
jgi:hypothetical protein